MSAVAARPFAIEIEAMSAAREVHERAIYLNATRPDDPAYSGREQAFHEALDKMESVLALRNRKEAA